MNEIQQRRLINQYKDYYKYYNLAVRPLEEKRPVQTVQGTVQWDERDIHRTTGIKVVR